MEVFTAQRLAALNTVVLEAALHVLRESEVEPAVARIEPTGGDDLVAGVEAEPLGAVRVGVAEQRCLPSAERVVADRYRHGHIDPDHADLHLVLVAPGRAA